MHNSFRVFPFRSLEANGSWSGSSAFRLGGVLMCSIFTRVKRQYPSKSLLSIICRLMFWCIIRWICSLSIKIDSVGKEFGHTPQGHGFNCRRQRKDLFGGWFISISVSSQKVSRPASTLASESPESNSHKLFVTKKDEYVHWEREKERLL